MIGETVSHYRITRELGAGGMGVVYEAEDTRLRRTVALKFLPPESARDPEAKARFIHEAQAASALDHPNICTVHEIDETADGRLFIAMACYEGETLKERIDRGPLKLDEALDITRQVAAGLSRAHERNIFHRDIKPANIFLTADGLVKILDFGLVKLAGQTQLTQQGTTLGTVAYMSPEQARGEPSDRRSDLWSLGAVLYEMVTGRTPFAGDHQQAVIYAIQNEEPEPVTALRTGVPVELERIAGKCLRKDPAERYQTALDLLADLRRERGVLSGETATVRHQAAGRGAGGWRRTLAGIAGLLVVILATALLFDVAGIRGLVSNRGAADRIASLAVLPLDNLMNDSEQDYFVAGMHEALITELSRIAALTVVSRTSCMRYLDTRKSVPDIAGELDVDAIVEGSVLRSGGRVRVTAQLIEGRTDRHLWADSFDRDLDDVLALHSEVARTIARQIEATVTPDEEARLERSRQVDPAVLDAYLRGKHLLALFSRDTATRAVEYFQQAIRLDPDFAPAHAALGLCYSLMGWAFDWASRAERYGAARDAVTRALELDYSLSEAHAGLAQILWEYDWDRQGAEREYGRAMELNGSDDVVRLEYSDFLSSLARHEESRRQARRAMELAPFSAAAVCQLAYSFIWAADYDEALVHLEHALELDPHYSRANFGIGRVYHQTGRYEEALALFERAEELSGFDSSYFRGRVYADMGEEMKARELLATLEGTAGLEVGKAQICLALGDIDRAFQFLEEALGVRARGLNWLKVDPAFDPLRDDPRYPALLEKVGLAE